MENNLTCKLFYLTFWLFRNGSCEIVWCFCTGVETACLNNVKRSLLPTVTSSREVRFDFINR